MPIASDSKKIVLSHRAVYFLERYDNNVEEIALGQVRASHTTFATLTDPIPAEHLAAT